MPKHETSFTAPAWLKNSKTEQLRTHTPTRIEPLQRSIHIPNKNQALVIKNPRPCEYD
jgi:hypothetical protein